MQLNIVSSSYFPQVAVQTHSRVNVKYRAIFFQEPKDVGTRRNRQIEDMLLNRSVEPDGLSPLMDNDYYNMNTLKITRDKTKFPNAINSHSRSEPKQKYISPSLSSSRCIKEALKPQQYTIPIRVKLRVTPQLLPSDSLTSQQLYLSNLMLKLGRLVTCSPIDQPEQFLYKSSPRKILRSRSKLQLDKTLRISNKPINNMTMEERPQRVPLYIKQPQQNAVSRIRPSIKVDELRGWEVTPSYDQIEEF